MGNPQHLRDAKESLKLAESTIFIVFFFACKIQYYLIKQCCRSKFRSTTKYFGSPNYEVFYDTSLRILSFLFAEIFSVTHRLINFFLGFNIRGAPLKLSYDFGNIWKVGNDSDPDLRCFRSR